jgi:serpin B
MHTRILSIITLFAMLAVTRAADFQPAATAVNSLGVDLYRTQAKESGNMLISPYSIQIALAMTYAGADGDTHAEMQRVLHFGAKEDALHGSFAALSDDLTKIAADSVKRFGDGKRGAAAPIEFNVGNRLFVQKRFVLRQPFVDLTRDRYRAPVESVDFTQSEVVRGRINGWVEKQTKEKIRDLIPSGALDASTRLVLANALYLRAPWDKPFVKAATKDEPFHVAGGAPVPVPTMTLQSNCGFADHGGFKIITKPYDGRGLQFVIVVPDRPDGLSAVERELTPELLAGAAKAEPQEVLLHLPKFRVAPQTMALSKALQSLGMKTAFDQPRGSANFDRMAPRKPDDYLGISEVMHKTFLALDEDGTEAAAATAVIMAPLGMMMKPKRPVEVRVDRPFFFAIQHVASGACLFLGRVNDPR